MAQTRKQRILAERKANYLAECQRQRAVRAAVRAAKATRRARPRVTSPTPAPEPTASQAIPTVTVPPDIRKQLDAEAEIERWRDVP